MTHFATADERGDDFFGEQLERFAAWAPALRERHPGLILHAANSAALLRDPDSHFDLVRAGVAIYGLDPFQEDAAARDLEPALELVSYVAEIKRCAPGESAGYGRRFVAQEETVLATVPIGYGDGVSRALTNNADLLVGRPALPARRHRVDGQRRPRPRRRRRRDRARRRGAAHRRRACPPRRWRGAWARSTTRSRAR